MLTSESPLMVELLRERREQLIREADIERMCALSTNRPRAWARLRYGVGDLLITLGHRIKA